MVRDLLGAGAGAVRRTGAAMTAGTEGCLLGSCTGMGSTDAALGGAGRDVALGEASMGETSTVGAFVEGGEAGLAIARAGGGTSAIGAEAAGRCTTKL